MPEAQRPLALVVEDESDVASLLSDILRDEDWRVVVASSVAAARRLIGELPVSPDLVILDQRLPDGRGLSLVSSIRRRFPEARVIAVTASVGITRELEGTLLDAVFHKPIELKRFLSEVEAAAQTKRVGAT